MFFVLFFTRQNLRARKIGRVSKVLRARALPSAPDRQFVQACIFKERILLSFILVINYNIFKSILYFHIKSFLVSWYLEIRWFQTSFFIMILET